MLALLIIVILVLVLLTGAPPIGVGALVVGAMFVGFWVLVIRAMVGVGRWLLAEPPPRHAYRAPGTRPGPPIVYPTSPRACPDPRCGRVNVPEARFCAQCGQPLGPSRQPAGLDRAGPRAA